MEGQNNKAIYRGWPDRIKCDFSMEILTARGAWIDGIQTLRDHTFHAKILYPENF